MGAKIIQVSIWLRDFDQRWSACILMDTGSASGMVLRRKRTFDTLIEAISWIRDGCRDG